MSRTIAAGVAAALVFAAGSAQAAVTLTGTGVYTNTFDTLASSGVASSGLNGFEFFETGANANSTYAAGTGSDNTGNTYSFGAAGSTERALGALRSGSLATVFGVEFVNDTGKTIIGFDVAYNGEFWRQGVTDRTTTDRLDFQYKVGSGVNTGSFTNVDSLDVLSVNPGGTAGARNGNAAGFRTAISGSVSGLNVANGQSVTLRFVDVDVSGADDGLAIDDFSFTPVFASAVVPEPATWAMMIGGFGLAGFSLRGRAGVAARA